MALTRRQQRQLRTLAHRRQPVVRLGQRGLTQAVLDETEAALGHHELIKVRLNAGDRQTRSATATVLCQHTGAELVQLIGRVAILYRRHPEAPVIALAGAED